MLRPVAASYVLKRAPPSVSHSAVEVARDVGVKSRRRRWCWFIRRRLVLYLHESSSGDGKTAAARYDIRHTTYDIPSASFLWPCHAVDRSMHRWHGHEAASPPLSCLSRVSASIVAYFSPSMNRAQRPPHPHTHIHTRRRLRDFFMKDVGAYLAASEEQQFDLVVAAETLQYLGPLDAVVADTFKVLKPGGYFSFTVDRRRTGDREEEEEEEEEEEMEGRGGGGERGGGEEGARESEMGEQVRGRRVGKGKTRGDGTGRRPAKKRSMFLIDSGCRIESKSSEATVAHVPTNMERCRLASKRLGMRLPLAPTTHHFNARRNFFSILFNVDAAKPSVFFPTR